MAVCLDLTYAGLSTSCGCHYGTDALGSLAEMYYQGSLGDVTNPVPFLNYRPVGGCGNDLEWVSLTSTIPIHIQRPIDFASSGTYPTPAYDIPMVIATANSVTPY